MVLQRYGGTVQWTQIHIGRRTWQAYCHTVNDTAAATYRRDLKFNSGAREQNRLPACFDTCQLCVPCDRLSWISISLWAHTHTHTSFLRPSGLCPELHGWASTEPVWMLLKQETMSGSGVNCAICKSALRPDKQPCQHLTTRFLQALSTC